MIEIESLFQKYLSGTASLEEKSKLNDWIASNKEVQIWLENNLANSPAQMDEQSQKEILQQIHLMLIEKKQPPILLLHWLKYTAAAIALIAMTAGSVLLLVSQRQEPAYTSIVETDKGQRSNVTLPDGTKVILNSETKLTYTTGFNKKQRSLKLEGEAFFDVAKNEKLPFVVHANKFAIQAVGTSFNVRAYANEEIISTTLIDGKVNIQTPDKTIELTPNKRAELKTNDNSSTIIALTDSKKSVGWLSDSFTFENATLSDVAAELSRAYNINIVLESKNIRQQRFTGRISNNSINSALRIISLTAPVRCEFRNNTVFLHEVEEEKDLFK